MNGVSSIVRSFQHPEHAEVVLEAMLNNAENLDRVQLVSAAEAAKAVGLGLTAELQEAARQAQDRLNARRLHSVDGQEKALCICLQAAVQRVVTILTTPTRLAA